MDEATKQELLSEKIDRIVPDWMGDWERKELVADVRRIEKKLEQSEAENKQLKEYILEEVGAEHVPSKWGGELDMGED